jgi:hypothetical protein
MMAVVNMTMNRALVSETMLLGPSHRGLNVRMASVVASDSLEVTHVGQRNILRFCEAAFCRPMQEAQLLARRARTLFRSLSQVLQHGPQAARDLDTASAELTDLGNPDGQSLPSSVFGREAEVCLLYLAPVRRLDVYRPSHEGDDESDPGQEPR